MKAIEIRELSKQYRLGKIGHGTLKQDLQSWWARTRGKADPNQKIGHGDKTGDFWALKDVSFDVNEGESLGVIGSNGAGKSTLLKLISRITTPTRGSIRIKGRVASLLEVGTGFNPELTGRENVYMNGAILGLTKAQITGKLAEIIDFSGVEEFIDTPVKRYSSGMYVRLAFAVAAHLEPEILIVDEVLAVGDYKFQKKCIGKMGDLSTRSGMTILFVSHNLSLIQELTTKAVWLNNGILQGAGLTEDILADYMRSNASARTNAVAGLFDLTALPRHREKHPRNEAEITSCRLENAAGAGADEFEEGDPVTINVEVTVKKPIDVLSIEMVVSDELNTRLFPVISEHLEARYLPGKYNFRTRIDPNYLRAGGYLGSFTIRSGSLQDGVNEGFRLIMKRHRKSGAKNANEFYDRLGSFRFPFTWEKPIAP